MKTAPPPAPMPPVIPPIPPLENGDRLTRDEFERRYEAMPELKKAELVEGVVRSRNTWSGECATGPSTGSRSAKDVMTA